MFLHLTRHGQPQPWREAVGDQEGLLGGDPALTDLGMEQARCLGRRLKSLGFRGRIWSSPYRRAAQTADLAAAELGTAFAVTAALRDIVKEATPRPHLRGLPLHELRARYPRLDGVAAGLPFPWWTDATDDRAGFTRRIVDWLEPLLAMPEDLLLVGHGATVNQLTQVFTRRAGRGDLGDWFGAWNAQLTTFEIREERVRLVGLADISFMPREIVTANGGCLTDGVDARTGAERFTGTGGIA